MGMYWPLFSILPSKTRRLLGNRLPNLMQRETNRGVAGDFGPVHEPEHAEPDGYEMG